jgi:hypothetical protein
MAAKNRIFTAKKKEEEKYVILNKKNINSINSDIK